MRSRTTIRPGGKKPAVTVTIGDHVCQRTLAVMGGEFMLPFSAEHRAASVATLLP